MTETKIFETLSDAEASSVKGGTNQTGTIIITGTQDGGIVIKTYNPDGTLAGKQYYYDTPTVKPNPPIYDPPIVPLF
ncbi:MAG: hypothetical protein DSM106950_45730 [Stigonema ocellatum SAG 48.90 = DSM 106950]|nr:hypothetical protein [Stigonema ocellatum SAG 48.90 = DSM 106950]